MLEQSEQKKSLKLKTMFRQQLDEHNSTLQKNAVAHLQISPPILQHSTSIYSLVSPTRTAFTNIYTPNGKEIPFELYQPVSPPPPIPKHKSPYALTKNSLSPAPLPPRSSSKRGLEQPIHPLDFVPDNNTVNINKETNFNKGRYADARRTVPTDPRETSITTTPNKNRRHSCSSTIMYNHKQDQQLIPIKEQQPQPQQHKSESTARVKSFRSKLRERRRSSKVSSSYSTKSAAATTVASIEQPCVKASQSTPLRKIKTYNVPKRIQDVEKEKKMQELEDLISGRRGSTLKLTLTPKGLS